MLINIVIGFVIPLILGLFLYKKDKEVIIFIAPISSVVSFLFNQIGYSIEWWDFSPDFEEDETLSALPMDIGLFPFLACLMIHIKLRKNIKSVYLIILFTTITTMIEYVGLLIGKVQYQKGWNIFFTFLSYACAYILSYLYFLLVKKRVFHKSGYK
jgi:hypothetical protein